MLIVAVAMGASAQTSLVRVPYKGTFQVEQFQKRGIEILAATKDGHLEVLADAKQRDYLLSLPYPVSVIAAEGMPSAAATLDADLGMYHTYAEMESVLTAWEGLYPSICQLDSIGSSIEGRAIWMLKVSDNVTVDEAEPEVLYMGNHHARELMTVDVPLRFAGYLLENYGVIAEVTNRVDDREIFFIPMVNPDGHVYVENNHSGWWGNWWRKNRRDNGGSFGVDLNRNYGYQWGLDDVGSSGNPTSVLYRGASAWSEPETQVVRDFVESREIVIWLSYHSYGELLLYPWGYIAGNTPDHQVFKAMGEMFTDDNGYLAGNAANGAIYLVNGDSDDWGYGEQVTKNKIFAFTPEMNTSAQGGFGPCDTLIAPTFNLMLEMNMEVLEVADNPYGVIGPIQPTMYAIEQPWYPTHTVKWSSSDLSDPNPVVTYELEKCKNPSFVTDECENASPNWNFDGFALDNDAYTGINSYYSGQGNNLNNSVTTTYPYLVDASTDTFTFWTKYTIELDWDYAYVEVSTDDGGSFTSIQGNITTSSNPHGTNLGHGITGSLPLWFKAIFPLTAYLGQEILVRISYVTDAAVVGPGIRVDAIAPVPTCASLTILSSSIVDTCYTVYPDETGTCRYRVRATDAQNDNSDWSTLADIVITTVTSADEPLRYASRLEQNYPNPFNPSTVLPYVVGGAVDGGGAQVVALKVYDVGGRLVRTLVADAQLSPGRHQASWNGVDNAGRPVASGIYFSQLVVGGLERQTRKLALLK